MSVIVIYSYKQNRVISVAKNVKAAVFFLLSSGWFDKGTANWESPDWREFYSWYPTMEDFQNAPLEEINAALDNIFHLEWIDFFEIGA